MIFSTALLSAIATLATAATASDDVSFTTTTVTMTSYISHQHTSASTVQPAYTYHFTNGTDQTSSSYAASNATSNGTASNSISSKSVSLSNGNVTSLLKRNSLGSSTPVIKSYQNNAVSARIASISAMTGVAAAAVVLLL